MGGVNFVQLYNRYRLRRLLGVDDQVDRLSYFHSFILLTGLSLVVTFDTYLFLRPIACHFPTAPHGGANFKRYIESYCWIVGTVPVGANESVPKNRREWANLSAERRISRWSINNQSWLEIISVWCAMVEDWVTLTRPLIHTHGKPFIHQITCIGYWFDVLKCEKLCTVNS